MLDKIHRKTLFILFTVFCLLWVHNAQAAFLDVPQHHPNSAAIEHLSQENILRGRSNGNQFDPNGPINRAEWAVILTRQDQANFDEDEYRNCFPDIQDQWFADEVCYIAGQGWLRGYQAGPEAGKFMPVNFLNTAEVLVTLQRVFNWDVSTGPHWYSGAMDYALEKEIITGLQFDQVLNRAQVAEILFRTLVLDHYGSGQYDPFLGQLFAEGQTDPDPTPAPPSGTPAATVQLRAFSAMPDGASVVRGATYVPVLRFELETDKPVVLEEIRIKRISIGRTEDLERGRIMANGKVLKERTFASEGKSVSWINLNLPLSPQDPVLMEFNVDFSLTAQPDLFYQFEVQPNDIVFEQPSVQVSGAFVRGETFTTNSALADTVIITNPSKKLKKPFMESENEIIARFNIQAGDHDVVIKRLKLRDDGSLSGSEYSNFRLSVGTTELSRINTINQNNLDFIMNDYLIEAGRKKTFTVYADIGLVRTRDSIRLYLEEPEDVHTADVDYDFGTQIDNQFGRDQAWCLGEDTVECSAEPIRKRCTREDREFGVQDCEEEEDDESEE